MSKKLIDLAVNALNKTELPNGLDRELCLACTKDGSIVRECSMCPLGDGDNSCRGLTLTQLIKRANKYCNNKKLQWSLYATNTKS